MSEKASLFGQIFSSKLVRGSYKDEPCDIDFKMKGNDQEKRRLTHLVNTIARSSKIGKDILEDAAKGGYELSFEYQMGSYGYCGHDNKDKKPVIVLNPATKDDDLITTLVHESRHAQQNNRGLGYDFGQLNVKSEVMLFRAMEADAQTCALMAALDIRETTGNEAPFKAFDEKCPNITAKLPKPIKDKEAPFKATKVLMQQAFDGWYDDSGIVYSYEMSYITSPMRRFRTNDKFENCPYDKNLTSKEIVEKMCLTPDGQCYFSNKPNVLEDKKKLTVNSCTLDFVDDFFRARENIKKVAPDKSYKSLPVECLGSSYDTYMDFDKLRDNKAEKAKNNIILNQKILNKVAKSK
ncbi:MAG: hypothetical protein MJ247_00375 [Alphaproteobacteria bacterium]|nr:hypothetical protein [Alphaproteobacteria bacterium]